MAASSAGALKTAKATKAKAVAAMTDGSVLDNRCMLLLQEGDDALEAGRVTTACARFSEVLILVESLRGSPDAIAAPSKSPRKRTTTFGGFASSCSACGAKMPKSAVWCFCSSCRINRYCSGECRSNAWDWGHADSCVEAALPTPDSITRKSAEAATQTLREYGRANAELAAACLRRILTDLERLFNAPALPSHAWVRDQAAHAARKATATAEGVVLPEHGAVAFETNVRRTVMQFEGLEDHNGSVLLSTLELGAKGAATAMSTHATSAPVQHLGCRLLGLASNYGGRATVMAADGLGCVLRALVAFPSSLHNEGMRALGAIAGGEGWPSYTPCSIRSPSPCALLPEVPR